MSIEYQVSETSDPATYGASRSANLNNHLLPNVSVARDIIQLHATSLIAALSLHCADYV